MNEMMVKKVSMYLLGAGLGAYIGYIAGELIVNKFAEEEFEETPREKEVEEIDGVDPKPIEKMDYSKASRELKKAEKGKLDELAAQYKTSLGSLESPERPEPPITPHIISIEEYTNSSSSYGKETIFFYEEDNTFANQNEEIIDGVDRTLGVNLHLHFGEKSEDPDIVYVRNEKESVDFEVIRLHTSYATAVLGVEETKPKPRKKDLKKPVKKTKEDEFEE